MRLRPCIHISFRDSIMRSRCGSKLVLLLMRHFLNTIPPIRKTWTFSRRITRKSFWPTMRETAYFTGPARKKSFSLWRKRQKFSQESPKWARMTPKKRLLNWKISPSASITSTPAFSPSFLLIQKLRLRMLPNSRNPKINERPTGFSPDLIKDTGILPSKKWNRRLKKKISNSKKRNRSRNFLVWEMFIWKPMWNIKEVRSNKHRNQEILKM